MFKKKYRFYEPSNIKNIVYKNNNILSHTFHNIADSEGLRRAYNQPNRIYIHGNRMYVAGTTWTDGYTGRISLNDAIDDLKIPFFQTRNIQRYKDAEEVLKDNPNINTLVGHSMGSSVILELNKANNDKFITRAYSSPVFDPFPNNWEKNDPNNQRFKTQGDLVSIFDNNPTQTIYKPTLNPLSLHAYDNYGDIGKGADKPITNDVSINIAKK